MWCSLLEEAALETKNPACENTSGFLFWRRPTLARPIAVLPSGLQRFTAVFGMGTGGTTALLSPECGTAPAVRRCRSDANAMSYSGDDVDLAIDNSAVIDRRYSFQRTFNNQLLTIN